MRVYLICKENTFPKTEIKINTKSVLKINLK